MDNLLSTLDRVCRMSVRCSPCRRLEVCNRPCVFWQENCTRGQLPSSWRFIVENMITKPQPHSVSTQEQNQATSSLSWDILYLSLEDTSVPLPAWPLVLPGTAPAALLSQGGERQRSSSDGTSLGQAILALVHDQSVNAAWGMLPILPLAALQNHSSWLHGCMPQKDTAQLKFKPNL